MALIAVGAAKGSPGVTTTAVALAALHPRPAVVADLDPVGGDLALRYRDDGGGPLDPDRGVLSLGAAVRHGEADPRPHLQMVPGGLEVCLGVSGPEQTTGLGPVWPRIATALRDLPDRDVVADCGRIWPGSPALAVLAEADAIVLVVRSVPEQLSHLRDTIRGLGTLTHRRLRAAPIGVVVIARRRDHAAAPDVQRLLASGGLAAGVLGALAHDPRGAGLLAESRARGLGRRPLIRSARSLSPLVLHLAAGSGPVTAPRHGHPEALAAGWAAPGGGGTRG